MPYFRLCADNKLATGTLSAVGHNPTQPPTNLLNDIKVSTLGKTGTSLTLVVVFLSPVTVRCVASVATNLTSSGTVSVSLYSDTVGVARVGLENTTPAAGAPVGVGNATQFPYGVLSKFAAWFLTGPQARRLEVTLSDPTLDQIQVSHLYVGDFWESPTVPVWGLSTGWGFSDAQAERNQAGDLVTTASPSFDQCSLTLEELPKPARRELQSVARALGSRKSLVAFTDDHEPDHDGLVYGRLQALDFQLPGYQGTSVQVSVDGW